MFKTIDPDQHIQNMRNELTEADVVELRTPDEVDRALKNQTESIVIFVNSVCGCAAGSARPGFISSLTGDIKPKHIYTVFAGQDKEATERARSYFQNHPPSSPSIVMLIDGTVAFMVGRETIETASAENISSGLKQLYIEHLKK